MDKPNETVLSRGFISPEHERILDRFARNIEKTVNFGTEVFARLAPNSSVSGVAHMQYRHILEMLDGVAALIRQGCADASKPLLRSVFETSVQLHYLLEKDTQRRTRAYEYAQLRREIKWLKDLAKNGSQVAQTVTTKELARKEPLLGLPNFVEVSQEWETTVKNGGPKYPNWYSLFGGPSNLRQLAQHVQMEDRYIVLYPLWSESTHGGAVLKNAKVDAVGGMVVDGLRNPKDLQTMASLAIGLGVGANRVLAKTYQPFSEQEFSNWYANEVKPDYDQIANDKIIVVEGE